MLPLAGVRSDTRPVAGVWSVTPLVALATARVGWVVREVRPFHQHREIRVSGRDVMVAQRGGVPRGGGGGMKLLVLAV